MLQFFLQIEVADTYKQICAKILGHNWICYRSILTVHGHFLVSLFTKIMNGVEAEHVKTTQEAASDNHGRHSRIISQRITSKHLPKAACRSHLVVEIVLFSACISAKRLEIDDGWSLKLQTFSQYCIFILKYNYNSRLYSNLHLSPYQQLSSLDK